MPLSLLDLAVDKIMMAKPSVTHTVSGKKIPYPYPSPADWRDHWIYFLLIDRFNNSASPPLPNIYPCGTYQGGNFSGIRQQLSYLKKTWSRGNLAITSAHEPAMVH